MDETRDITLVLSVILVVGVLGIFYSSFYETSSSFSTGQAAGYGDFKAECQDGWDNDGDGFVDLKDSGCENRKDSDESSCGDFVCEGDETCSVCSRDCGTCPPR